MRTQTACKIAGTEAGRGHSSKNEVVCYDDDYVRREKHQTEHEPKTTEEKKEMIEGGREGPRGTWEAPLPAAIDLTSPADHQNHD